MSFPLAAGLTRDNLPLEHARELCEHLKDSCNLVCIEKTLLRLAFGVFGGCRWKEEKFCFFFGYSFMTSSPGQCAEIVAYFAITFEPEMLESLSNPLKTRIVA